MRHLGRRLQRLRLVGDRACEEDALRTQDLTLCVVQVHASEWPHPFPGSGAGLRGVGFPEGLTVSIEGDLTVDGVTFGGPALKHAEAACKEFLPGGGGPPPAMSASEKKQALQLAECMRANGVPNFPDPGSVGQISPASKPASIPDESSPAFKHAVQVCGHGGAIRVSGSNVSIGGP